ncbi:MAG: 5'-methylthioadenosine/adenosylhomocysteine nucleosidase [Clostridia bacterium]|nr:5'-methylthioadenosine/adenosylhomocysteine nucleosidase [Clostridia bacterium]MDR3644642.1 5'-methylthioadenosine/adenosylhomocysteine nucleosidase [Clostridia bacterium]
MKTTAVIAAMPVELEGILTQLGAQEKKVTGFYRLYEASFCGSRVIFACCGIGKVNAAACTQRLIDYCQPDAIINMGIAGGISAELSTLDVVIGSEVVYHDFSPISLLENNYPFAGSFVCDKALIELAKQVCAGSLAPGSFRVGRIASGDCFVEAGEVRTRIRDLLGGLCCEMEGAAIGQVSHANGVPFLILRSISDLADENAQMSYEEFESKASLQANRIVTGLLSAIAQGV